MHEDLRTAISDLQARVEALERDAAAHPPRRRRREPDLGLLEALGELTEPPADSTSLVGTLTYAGVAELADDALSWQMVHAVPDLLALDEARLARQLAAIRSEEAHV